MRKTGNYRPEPVLALATGATRRVRGYSCDTTFDPRSSGRPRIANRSRSALIAATDSGVCRH